MTSYIIRRLIGLIPLFLGVIILSYSLLVLAPGGPAGSVQSNPRMTQEMKDAWLDRWCLEDSKDPAAILRMFGGWTGVLNCERDGTDAFFSEQGGLNVLPAFLGGGDNGLLHGDLGNSLESARPVFDVIWERLPATIVLAGVALVIWISTAIALGTFAAVRRYSIYDQALTFLTYIMYSLPTFWLGLMLIFLFGPALHLLPTGGVVNARDWPAFGSPQFWAAAGERPLDAMYDIGRHLILPVVTLVAVNIAADSRFVRASMLETLSADFVRTARAKGLSARRVIGRHAFRNAMLPVTTNIALEIPFLVSGAVVVETIFSWPGVGRLFITSVNERDYYVLMGLIMMTSFAILLANLLADVVYAIIDPRIRY